MNLFTRCRDLLDERQPFDRGLRTIFSHIKPHGKAAYVIGQRNNRDIPGHNTWTRHYRDVFSENLSAHPKTRSLRLEIFQSSLRYLMKRRQCELAIYEYISVNKDRFTGLTRHIYPLAEMSLCPKQDRKDKVRIPTDRYRRAPWIPRR